MKNPSGKNAPRKIERLIGETLLAMAKGSAGSKAFQHSYALVDGKRTDLARNGDLSCAFFVTSLLHFFNLIKAPHLTVSGTVEDMETSGWKRIKTPRVGCIITWKAWAFENGEDHPHIGIYLGKDKAVSNNSKKRTPVIHHWTFGKVGGKAKREVEALYWHVKLET